MLLPYRIQPNNNTTKNEQKEASNTNFDINLHHNLNVERPRLTSNAIKPTSNESVTPKENKLKGGANIEINEHY